VVKNAVAATSSAVAIESGAITASDDWARFSERVPAAFFFVGAGGSDAAPHHHPAFDIDESSIAVMCEILVRTALAQRAAR
jgi:amidohydrolase